LRNEKGRRGGEGLLKRELKVRFWRKAKGYGRINPDLGVGGWLYGVIKCREEKN